MLNFLRSQKSFKALIFLGLLGLIVLIFSQQTDLTTSDLGRHLTNGRSIWNNPDILFHNFYSYTEPNFPFINHHWLYGVIVYAVYRSVGFVGLSIFNIFIILTAFSLAFFIASRKIGAAGTGNSAGIGNSSGTGNSAGIGNSAGTDGAARAGSLEMTGADGFYFASFLSLPAILLLSERVEIRPEIFSYLFIVLTYWILDSAAENKKYRRLWLLIPLFALWANIHIYFFIGLAFVGFKAVSMLLDAGWRVARPRLIIFGAAVLVCLLNPNTWRGLLYPFSIFKNYGYEIAENKSVFFLEHLTVDYNFGLFKFVFVLLCASWALYFIFFKRDSGFKERFILIFRKRLFDLLISVFIASLALFSSRNISLFGLVSLIIIGANMAPVLFFIPSGRRVRIVIPVFLLLSIAAIFFFLSADARRANNLIKNPFGLGLYENNEASAAFFKEKNLSGPIFNNYDIGGALIFWLWDREKVFVDNRPEAYSSAFFNEVYKPMQSDPAAWDKYSEQYNFKTIYFTHTDGTPWARQFLGRILQDEKWRPVYLDAYTIILIDLEKYNAATVRALSLDNWMIKKKIRELSAGADVKTKLHLANLAQLAGLPEMAEEIYRGILLDFPEQAQTFYSLAELYAGYGEQADLIRSLSYSQRALDAGLRLPGVYNDRGLVYWGLGQYEKAEDAWRSALKRERKNTHALYYLNQIEILKQKGDLPVE